MAPSLFQLPLLSSFLNVLPSTTPATISTIATTVQSCPNPPSLSCPFPPPREINTCCLNHPSGHFLQTQFWDTSPALGPDTSWTIHGLWPDLCTGGFDQFCDSTRSHPPGAMRNLITTLLNHTHSDSTALLDFMDEYWLSLNSDPAHLWSHEWNKHGTCISTLEQDCYPSSPDAYNATDSRNQDQDVESDSGLDLGILDYFIHATSLFRTLDTHTILSEAGIVPSHDVRYSLQELEDAISSSPHGYPVTFRCTQSGELNEIWYHFSVMGSLRNSYDHDHDTSSAPPPPPPFLPAETVREIFVPTDPDGAKSNCPSRGIKYLPKNKASDPGPHPSPTQTHTRTSTATSTPTTPPFTGKGHLAIHVLDDESSSRREDLVAESAQEPFITASSEITAPSDQQGCLIRLGQWYVSGTCATFRAQTDVVDPGHAPLFSLSSSYSPCVINRATSKFECAKSTAVQSIFSSDPQNPRVLSYQNRTIFYAHHVPKRFDKVEVYADDGEGERSVRVEIHWIATT
ncbi:Ribonuclease T2 precursor (RNase T2) [Rhinocladiella similis]